MLGHDEDARTRAESLGRRLGAGDSHVGLGDPFAHGTTFPSSSDARIERNFGAEFAARIREVPVDQWTLLRSAYGLHWVRVDGHEAERELRVEDVEARLRADFRARELEARVDLGHGVLDKGGILGRLVYGGGHGAALKTHTPHALSLHAQSAPRGYDTRIRAKTSSTTEACSCAGC